MNNYLQLMRKVMAEGEYRRDRTGVGCYSLFGESLVYDLSEGFPLVTTRRIHFPSIVGELLWFLNGETNAVALREKYSTTIWDEWADENGDLGPIYGHQWRHLKVDQIRALYDGLRDNPYSRRHVVCSWNVEQLDQMALPPCHLLFQMFVHDNGCLDCQVYQRSADLFLGVPFNIASYALLTEIFARLLGLCAGKLHMVFGDVHLYSNAIQAAVVQNQREPKNLPFVCLPSDLAFDNWGMPIDYELIQYYPYSPLYVAVAV